MSKPLSLILPGRTMPRPAFDLAETITRWWSRARERRALRHLDERLLRDVGLTRLAARCETAKPFWQP